MRTRTILAATATVGGLVLAASSAANAVTFNFTQIDVPGAIVTCPAASTTREQIVGVFWRRYGPHGFLYTGGSFTQIDVPAHVYGRQGHQQRGADRREFFQQYRLPRLSRHRRELHPNRRARRISTYACRHQQRGADRRVLLPTARVTMASSTPAAVHPNRRARRNLYPAFGINDAGQIVGPFIDSTGVHGFLDTGGSFTQIDVPGAISTQAFGINDAGQIVGVFR